MAVFYIENNSTLNNDGLFCKIMLLLQITLKRIRLYYIIFIPIFLSILFYFFVPYLKALSRSRKKYGKLKLEAIKTHTNRGLSFTKGEEYTFNKIGDILIVNEDDISRDRDNYSFYRCDIEGFFKPNDTYSRIVVSNTRYYPR